MLHGQTEIAGFRLESCETLQASARATASVQHEINRMTIVQGGTKKKAAPHHGGAAFSIGGVSVNHF